MTQPSEVPIPSIPPLGGLAARGSRMDESVRAAIRQIIADVADPAVSAVVSGVLRLSLLALSDMAGMEDAICNVCLRQASSVEFIAAAPVAPASPAEDGARPMRSPSMRPSVSERSARELGPDELAEVVALVFRGMRRLTGFMTTARLLEEPASGPIVGQTEEGSDGFLDLDDGFDLALEQSMAGTKGPTNAPWEAVDELELDRAFDFVTNDANEDIQSKIDGWKSTAASLGYALQQEHRGYEARIQRGLQAGQNDVVFVELETASGSLNEGLFALVMTTFQTFRADISSIDRAALLPGYKTSLERALTIRRALADLRYVVVTENDVVIQDDSLPYEVRADSLARVAEELERFTQGEAFHLMTAAQRLELSGFLSSISGLEAGVAEQYCEGLAKYLESLSLVSRREALERHDGEILGQAHWLVEAARSVGALNESEARSFLREAMAQIDKLYGRNPALDDEVREYRADPEHYGAGLEVDALLARLEPFVR